MKKIVILDENTANQIAAGEVIERPASIVKEMVENALDANATAITVDIMNGGIKSIRITDNGDGIEAGDVDMAFERHATSKIRGIDDLNTLSTMGFRGEALASIASVSKVEVVTKTEEAGNGVKVMVEAGCILSSEPTGAPKGTTFVVRELFYNTPARYKFLKRDATEAGYIQDILYRIALARPDVSIKLISQGKTVLHTPGNHDLLSVIYSLYGKDVARAVLPLSTSYEGLEVSGYIGKPEIARGNRNFQTILVNGRSVSNRMITAALEEAYKTKLMQKRFPFAVLKLQVSPQTVDVNVHPAKLEVRFSDDKKIFRAVYHAVIDALSAASLIPRVEAEETEFPTPGKRGERDQPAVYERIPIDETKRNDMTVSPQGEQTPRLLKKDRSLKESLGYDTALHLTKIKEEPVQRNKGGYTETQSAADEPGYIEPIENKTPETIETMEKEQQEMMTPPDDRKRLLEARILGQAFDSFVLLEEEEKLFLIDQHAAHERIRFEKIKKQYTGGKSFSQGLLSPITVNLSQLEMNRFHDHKGYFERFGFEVEDFGNRTVLIRAVPTIWDSGFSSQDFVDILEKLCQEVSAVSEIIPEETLFMMACKSAIKANRTLSHMEINGLLKELTNTENPYTCVHGRPIIISIHKKELEKRFKRIV